MQEIPRNVSVFVTRESDGKTRTYRAFVHCDGRELSCGSRPTRDEAEKDAVEIREWAARISSQSGFFSKLSEAVLHVRDRPLHETRKSAYRRQTHNSDSTSPTVCDPRSSTSLTHQLRASLKSISRSIANASTAALAATLRHLEISSSQQEELGQELWLMVQALRVQTAVVLRRMEISGQDARTKGLLQRLAQTYQFTVECSEDISVCCVEFPLHMAHCFLREEHHMYRLVAISDSSIPFLGPLRPSLRDAELDAENFAITQPQSLQQMHKFFETLRIRDSSRNFRLSAATVDTSDLFYSPVDNVCEFLVRMRSEISSLHVHGLDERTSVALLADLRAEMEILHEQVAVACSLDPVTRTDLISALHVARVQLLLVLDAVEDLVGAQISKMAVLDFQLLLANTRLTLDACGTMLQLTRDLIQRRHC